MAKEEKKLLRNARTSGIYKITCLVNNKCYIGSSVDIYKRLCTHKFQLRRNKHNNKYFQRAWNKYGEDNFVFELLEETSDLLEREAYYFSTTRCCEEEFGFNLCERPSAGITKTGPEHFNYGRKHTGKALENIIAAIKDRPPEWREKIYAKTRGRKQSDEERIKRSLISVKRKLTPEQVYEIRQLFDKMTNKDIASKFNVAACTISMIKTGRSNKLV